MLFNFELKLVYISPLFFTLKLSTAPPLSTLIVNSFLSFLLHVLAQ